MPDVTITTRDRPYSTIFTDDKTRLQMLARMAGRADRNCSQLSAGTVGPKL